MASSRSKELYQALQAKGYSDDFCRELAYRQLNTDYTATRMLGYLYRISEPRIEDVVDEMLAIQSDRNAIIQKKELEQAQAAINRMYRKGWEVKGKTGEISIGISFCRRCRRNWSSLIFLFLRYNITVLDSLAYLEYST